MICKMVLILLGGALVIGSWIFGINQGLDLESFSALSLFTTFWGFLTWNFIKENEPLE